MIPFRSSFRRGVPRLLLSCAMLTGCVAYDAADVDLPGVAATLPLPPSGPLSFEAAVAFALQHNPELQQLAAEARAAGADVPATTLDAQLDGNDEMLAVMLDPIALLRLGERGAAADLAAARGEEAVAALAVARWRVVGRMAEVAAALYALAEVPEVEVAIDAGPFERAGLASPNAAAQLRAAASGADAEVAALRADRAMLLAELRRLMGLPAGAPLDRLGTPGLGDAATGEDALLRRPDLALALAQYGVADAAFRMAVAAQYPSISIGPDLPLSSGGGVDVMALVKLPLFADGPALAAKERRSAARAKLVAAFVAASAEADVATRQHDVASRRALAAREGASASAMALTAATAALETEIDAFGQAATSATEAVRMATEYRAAAIAAARARVQHAVAWGWPLSAHPRSEGER